MEGTISLYKKYGIRARFVRVTITGIARIAMEVATNGVKLNAKRYLDAILVDTGLTCISGGISILTNTTKVVKYSKAIHSVCAASWRAAHNIAELPMISFDYAVFGEYVSSCREGDYHVYSTGTYIIYIFTDT